jgi:HEAT repeat protein
MTSETRNAISDLLTGDDPDLRRRAAEELAAAPGLAPVTALAAALEDDNKGVRDAAGRALFATGGLQVARAIVEYIGHDNIVTRNLVAELLVKLGAIAIPAILPYLDHESQDVRKFAVDILGLIGSDEPTVRMLPLLRDADENVVVSTVEALGNMKSVASIEALCGTYDRYDYARPVVAEALGKIGSKEAGQFLMGRFSQSLETLSTDPVTPFAIIEALGGLGSSDALARLRESVDAVRGTLRSATLHAMVRISERLGRPLPSAPGFKEGYLQAMKESEPAVRISGVKGVSAYGGGDVTEALIRSMGSSPEVDTAIVPVLLRRDETLNLATASLMFLPASQRKAVIGLVGRLTMETIQHVMRRAISTGDEEIFDRAFVTIADQWDEADEETRAVIVDALFRLDGDRAVEFLDAIMNDPDPWLRIHVIEVIAAIADPRAPDFIARFMQDDDEMVREVAMGTLHNTGLDLAAQS